MFAQKIGCGCKLDPPRIVAIHRGGSNEYPQPMFLIKNKIGIPPTHTSYLSI